jgi:hypothetical protein
MVALGPIEPNPDNAANIRAACDPPGTPGYKTPLVWYCQFKQHVYELQTESSQNHVGQYRIPDNDLRDFLNKPAPACTDALAKQIEPQVKDKLPAYKVEYDIKARSEYIGDPNGTPANP